MLIDFTTRIWILYISYNLFEVCQRLCSDRRACPHEKGWTVSAGLCKHTHCNLQRAAEPCKELRGQGAQSLAVGWRLLCVGENWLLRRKALDDDIPFIILALLFRLKFDAVKGTPSSTGHSGDQPSRCLWCQSNIKHAEIKRSAADPAAQLQDDQHETKATTKMCNCVHSLCNLQRVLN